MIRIANSFFIFLFSTTVYAQSTLTTFPGSYIKIFYGQALGDSAVFFGKSDEGIFQAMVFPTYGSHTTIPLPELQKKALCAAHNSKSSIDFYYFEKKDDYNLKMLRYDKSKKIKSIVDSGISLTGKLIGSAVSEDNLFLFQLLPDETVKVLQVKSGKIHTESSFKLTLPFNEYSTQGKVAIIQEGVMITALQAEALIKIYLKDNQVTISFEFENEVKLVTLKMDTGETEYNTIADHWGEDYGTFIHQDTLYTVSQINKDYFKLNAYSVATRQKINSFEINKDAPFINELSFLRDENTKVVLNNKSVWDAMSNGGRPFICAYSLTDGSTMLKMGTHRTKVTGSMVPLPGIIGGMVSYSINQATGTEKSLDLYFFMKGNLTDGFRYDNSLTLEEQRIDTFETYDRKTKRKTKYRIKAYVHVPGKTYSFYKTTDDSSVKVLIFKRSKDGGLHPLRNSNTQ